MLGPHPRHHLTVATTALLLLFMHHTNAQQQQQQQQLTTVINPSSHQTFADKLTSLLYTNDNECSSALGVSMAFSLIYPGCTGDAIDEVKETLRYPDRSNMQLLWEETTTRMLTASSGQCLDSWGDGDECYSEAPILKIANSVWLHDHDVLNESHERLLLLNDSYEELVGEFAIQTDFTSPESPVAVNDWVKNSTNGLIDEIVDPREPLFPPALLLAINSIYLKARWHRQFKERFTNLDTFYSSVSCNEQVSEAHFMHAVGYFFYSHNALPGYQVIDLNFSNSKMSMIFVLPMDTVNADEDVMVSSSDLITALKNGGLQSTRVALSLPKFKFESKYEDGLKDALQELGIEAPFTKGVEALCGVLEEDDYCDKLFVGKVIQKTVIDVNEKGVEAAAVTVIMAIMAPVSVPGPEPEPPRPILMVLDHPFQFFIYDKNEHLMLFEGRVGAPEVPDKEPEEALLDGKHEDEDFWSKFFSVDPVVPQPTGTSVTAMTTTAATTPINPTSDTTMTTSTSSTGSSIPVDPVVPRPTGSSATAMTSTAAATSVNPTSDATITTSTSSTASSIPEPVPISSSGNRSHKKFVAFCTSILSTFALSYVL